MRGGWVGLVLVCMGVLLAGCVGRQPSATLAGAAAGGAEALPEGARSAVVKEMPEQYVEQLPPVLRRIHERGRLRVALYSEDRFPFFFVDERGELVGSDIELANDIARQLGFREVEFDRSAPTYEGIIDRVAAGQVDMAIAKISITLNRAQRVLYSDPYLSLHQAVLLNRIRYARLRAGEADPLSALKERQEAIGVMRGTSYMEFAAENFPRAEIVPFDSRDALLQAVRSGEILAAFYDEFEFKRYLNSHLDAVVDLQLWVLEERKDDLAVAVPAGAYHLQSWLNHYLAYRKPLDLEQIIKRYGNQALDGGGSL